MSLLDLITDIIIEDTKRKECVAIGAKALSAQANMVKDKLAAKKVREKTSSQEEK